MKPSLRVNVTCSNAACTKPLFSYIVKGKEIEFESFGAKMRESPPRLGVSPKLIATCMHCGATTEMDRPF